MYVVYDSKSECYNKPFCMINDKVALRSAETIVADDNNEISKHPEDYTMFRIGTFEDTTAVLELLAAMEVICRFHQLSVRPAPELDLQELKERVEEIPLEFKGQRI